MEMKWSFAMFLSKNWIDKNVHKIGFIPTILSATLLLLWCAAASYGMKFQIGLNGSFVPQEMAHAGPGVLCGFEGETRQLHTITVRSGLYVSSRAGAAKNKRVWSYPGVLSLYNVDYSVAYVQVPFLIKYDWPAAEGALEVFFGPSLALAVMNHSNATFLQILDDSYARGETDIVPPHDYLRMEDPPPHFLLNLSNSTIFWNVGIARKFRNKYVELRYSLGALNNADYIEMNALVHAVHILFGFSLKK